MRQHFLISADAFEALSQINSKVDAVIVDPPYNTANKNTKILKGRKARSSDFGKWDYFADHEYLNFTEKWLNLVKPILKPSGNLLIFCKLEYVSDVKRIYEKLGFKHHATIIWHKTNPAPQIRKTGFLSSCEAILWATNGFDGNKISYTFNFSKQNEMHNFFESPICMGKERTPHPTQKPKKVLAHLIKIFTNEKDWVLDCFAGSGTTADACHDLNRNSISIEADKNYFGFMEKRLKNIQNMNVVKIKNIKKMAFKNNS